MTRRLVITACSSAVMLLLWALPGAAEPPTDPDKACKKGYVLGAGTDTDADTDDNGFVCVDPDTGEVRDDKGQFAPDGPGEDDDPDQNGNKLVCLNDDGVLVDDDGSGGCPPGFVLVPNQGRGPRADDNHDGLVCYDPANDQLTDNSQPGGGTCPSGYVLYPVALFP